MIIKGLKMNVDNFILDKDIDLQCFADKIGVSDKTLFNFLKSESIPKSETFIKTSKVLQFDLNKFLDTGIMEKRIINNMGVVTGSTINNVIDGSRHELELIIEHQKIEIAGLKDAIQQREIIISLLKIK
jgi:hypothetical protein